MAGRERSGPATTRILSPVHLKDHPLPRLTLYVYSIIRQQASVIFRGLLTQGCQVLTEVPDLPALQLYCHPCNFLIIVPAIAASASTGFPGRIRLCRSRASSNRFSLNRHPREDQTLALSRGTAAAAVPLAGGHPPSGSVSSQAIRHHRLSTLVKASTTSGSNSLPLPWMMMRSAVSWGTGSL